MLRWIGEWARAIRFGRAWMRGGARVASSELSVDRGDDRVPATLYLPASGVGGSGGARGGLPGWVVLHGVTRPGRFHPSLVRFAESLAGTGAAVLVPEIPEWRELRLDPERAVPTIQAAVLSLDQRQETEPGRTGLLGFSFGAPQAIVASTDPRLDGHLAAVVGFGAYCDLVRTVRFQFTGRHEWKGRSRHLAPDPYGRWIVGANYLTDVPGHEDAGPVAEALHRLAREAGDRRLVAYDPAYDPLKRAARQGLPPGLRPLFDLFAPVDDHAPDAGLADALAVGLAEAARRRSPAVDPRPYLARVRVPVRLIHGLQDELIPYTESLRLEAAFPPGADVTAFVTGLFAHSKGQGHSRPLAVAREAVRFLEGFRQATRPV